MKEQISINKILLDGDGETLKEVNDFVDHP